MSNTFSSRPLLDDSRFRQESDSTLTLSGTTKIVDLELFNGSTFVPFTGGTGGGSGFTKSLNGLNDNGTTIKLGGPLTENTYISGAYTLNISGSAQINTDNGYKISGVTVLKLAPSTSSSLFLGLQSGKVSTGVNNIGLGYASLSASTAGVNNIGLGYASLFCNTTGDYNIAIGSYSMLNATESTDNIAIGDYSLSSPQTYFSTGNVGIGRFSLSSNNTGYYNVGIGCNTLLNNTSGHDNVSVGISSLRANVNGCNNVAIGNAALRTNVNGCNNVAIGNGAGLSETGSSKLHIANSNACSLISGDFAAKTVKIDGILSVTSYRFGSTLSASTNTVVFDGDSRTVGYAGEVLPAHPYSDEVTLTNFTKFNTADGGATITDNTGEGVRWLFDASYENVDSKYNDVASHNVVVIWAGYNDMAVKDKSQNDTFDQLRAYCLERKARGWKVLVCTESDYFNIGGTSRRNGYNSYIKSQWRSFADGLVDLAANALVGGDVYETDLTYQAAADSATTSPTAFNIAAAEAAFVTAKTVTGTSYFVDGVHMTAAGYNVVAGLVQTVITNLIARDKFPTIKYSLNTQTSVYGGYSSGNDTSAAYNTGLGFCVMTGLTTGAWNIGLGYNALARTGIGNDNVAIGCDTLSNNSSGCNNIAIGSCVLNLNMTGIYNIGLGYQTLCSSTSGTSNVSIGFNSSYKNIDGNYNVALGHFGLSNNTIGDNNVALGYYALNGNCTGCNNIALGEGAMTDATSDKGSNNVAIGTNTMRTSTSVAVNNVAVGNSALSNLTSGCNNIGIGMCAGADALEDITTASNTVVIGNNTTTKLVVKQAWVYTSDIRDKTCISTVSHGLDFVEELDPISYKFKKNRECSEPTGRCLYGFSAQDVLALEGDNPVIVENSDENHLKISETYIVPILVNAIKELSARNSALESRIIALENK